MQSSNLLATIRGGKIRYSGFLPDNIGKWQESGRVIWMHT